MLKYQEVEEISGRLCLAFKGHRNFLLTT